MSSGGSLGWLRRRLAPSDAAVKHIREEYRVFDEGFRLSGSTCPASYSIRYEWQPGDRWLNSMTLLAKEVMPKLADLD